MKGFFLTVKFISAIVIFTFPLFFYFGGVVVGTVALTSALILVLVGRQGDYSTN